MHADEGIADVPAKAGAAATRPEGSGKLHFWLTNEFGLFVLILLFGAAFSLLTTGFLSTFNQFTLGRVAAINIMVGFAMMVVIVTGGLNLAVGAIGVCAAMSFGWLIEAAGLPWPVALVGALTLGAGLGFVNGFVVVFLIAFSYASTPLELRAG